MTEEIPMLRALTTCLLLAACGAPAARPAELVAHAVVAPAPKAAPAPRPAAPEVERPSWLEPGKRGRTVVTSTSITILDQIGFIGISSMIDPISYPMLDALALTLDGNPSIRGIEITASGGDGPAQWQLRLGDERARVIRDYLVHKGVDRARLRAHGTASVPVRTAFLILQRD